MPILFSAFKYKSDEKNNYHSGYYNFSGYGEVYRAGYCKS